MLSDSFYSHLVQQVDQILFVTVCIVDDTCAYLNFKTFFVMILKQNIHVHMCKTAICIVQSITVSINIS